VKFGGRIGHVEDPKSGVPVEAMVHGEFSFRVEDAEKLIVGLVGLGRTAVAPRSFLDAGAGAEGRARPDRGAPRQEPVAAARCLLGRLHRGDRDGTCIEGIDRHVESYGIRVVRLGNFVVAIDEEDSENLKKLYTDAAYLQARSAGSAPTSEFAAGKAMLGARRGHGEGRRREAARAAVAGALMGGAGLGVGFGLAQMLVRDHRGGESLAPATPGLVCPSCEKGVAPGRFCSHCGVELRAKEEPKDTGPAFCSGCGSPLGADAAFCAQCGRKRDG
jgi:hypothetical protein